MSTREMDPCGELDELADRLTEQLREQVSAHVADPACECGAPLTGGDRDECGAMFNLRWTATGTAISEDLVWLLEFARRWPVVWEWGAESVDEASVRGYLWAAVREDLEERLSARLARILDEAARAAGLPDRPPGPATGEALTVDGVTWEVVERLSHRMVLRRLDT